MFDRNQSRSEVCRFYEYSYRCLLRKVRNVFELCRIIKIGSCCAEHLFKERVDSGSYVSIRARPLV